MRIFAELFVSLVIMSLLSSNVFALGSNQSINEDGQIVETFHLNAEQHLIALTGGPSALLQPYPSNIQNLYESNIADGLAVITKFTDSSGEVVGIASELEHITTDSTGNVTADVQWTLKIPGRGTVVVTQTENFTALIALATDIIINGEVARYLTPPLTTVTTVPNSGKIIAGLGEFEGISGSFQETNAITYLNVVDGTIGVDITLQITYDYDKNKNKDNQGDDDQQ
jgi:hypothetical protein